MQTRRHQGTSGKMCIGNGWSIDEAIKMAIRAKIKHGILKEIEDILCFGKDIAREDNMF